jgi:DNA-3-methyladenine glycosylase
MRPLNQRFYTNKTEVVAKNLLGKILVRKNKNMQIKAIITETEAYLGQKDRACHAFCGITPRTKVMFGLAGFWYVYLIYGMYYCLNIVTEEKGIGSAVLIRGVKSIEGIKEDVKLDGPGKLCRAFEIDKSFNKTAAFTKDSQLYIKGGFNLAPNKVKKSKRIGIDYAGKKWSNRLLRFYVEV